MNLRRLHLLIVTVLLVVSAGVMFGQNSVKVYMFQDTSSTDGIDSGYLDSLTFGIDPTATLCIDASLGETELPPAPPSTAFYIWFSDSYLENPCLGEGLEISWEPADTILGNEYGFQMRPAGDATIKSMRLTWPAGLNSTWKSLVINDDGSLAIDMLAQTTVTLTRAQYFNKQLYFRGVPIVSAVKMENSLLPGSFSLNQNYPNPFNPSTTIKFTVATAAFTDIAVFDVVGRRIATLASEELKPGFYTTTWNGTDANGVSVSSGVYYVRMVANNADNVNFTQTQKLLLMK